MFGATAKVEADTEEQAIDIVSEQLKSLHIHQVCFNKVATEKKLIVMCGSILDYNEEKERFINSPEEIRWDFCNSFEEYIYQEKGIIVNGYVFSPKEYADMILTNENFPEVMSSGTFDEIVSEAYNLWNYPLDETDEILENNLDVVLVKFTDGIRLVEVR